MRSRAIPAAAIMLLAPAPLCAGPLNPPAGPVAPTHKTLTQVEPRTPIDADTTPGDATSVSRISQPGSYYLTGNLAGQAGRSGIEVAAPGVTIDLNGFTLQGVSGSLDAVRGTVAATALAVRNGTILGWGEDGADASAAEGARITDLTVQQCAGHGLVLVGDAAIARCVARLNGGDGVRILSTSLQARTASVSGCTSSGNSGNGFTAANGTAFAGCVAEGNGLDGFEAGGRASLHNCVAMTNGIDGITVGAGSLVHTCVSGANTDGGITGLTLAGSGVAIIDCNATFNLGPGIVVTHQSVVRGNLCRSNANNGGNDANIHVLGFGNHVEGNTCIQATRGIDVDGAANVIVGNAVTGASAAAYDIIAGNVVGTVITAPISPAVVGGSGGAGAGTTDPRANLAY